MPLQPSDIEAAWQEKLARFREAMARQILAGHAAMETRRAEQNARTLVLSLRGDLINFAAQHGCDLPPDLAVFGYLSEHEEE